MTGPGPAKAEAGPTKAEGQAEGHQGHQGHPSSPPALQGHTYWLIWHQPSSSWMPRGSGPAAAPRHSLAVPTANARPRVFDTLHAAKMFINQWALGARDQDGKIIPGTTRDKTELSICPITIGAKRPQCKQQKDKTL